MATHLMHKSGHAVLVPILSATLSFSAFFWGCDGRYKNDNPPSPTMASAQKNQPEGMQTQDSLVNIRPSPITRTSTLTGTRLIKNEMTEQTGPKEDPKLRETKLSLATDMIAELHLKVTPERIVELFTPIGKKYVEIISAAINRLNAQHRLETWDGELVDKEANVYENPALKSMMEKAYRAIGASNASVQVKQKFVDSFFGIEAQARDLESVRELRKALDKKMQ